MCFPESHRLIGKLTAFLQLQHDFFFFEEVERSIMMKKWLQTEKPEDRGESLRSLQETSKERITSVANQYFTNLWGVGGSQGRGTPSIEYRDRKKAKEQCEKFCGEVRHGHSSIG